MQTFEFEIVFKHEGINMTKTIGSGAEAPIHNRAARSGPLIARFKGTKDSYTERTY